MDKSKSYIAFFDLDKTLLSVNSGKILILAAYQKNTLSKLNLAKALFLSLIFKMEITNNGKIAQYMVKWLKGIEVKELEILSKQIFETTLKHSIRKSMLDQIEYHKRNKAKVVILSAAMDTICNPIAQLLEFDDVISSKMQVNDGKFTGKLQGKLCMEEQKAVLLKGYCNTHNYDYTEAYYYGDSISDKYALEIVGNPRCVSPDRRLLKLAKERNWEIIK